MGIKPDESATGVETHYLVDGSDAAAEIIADAEQTGAEAGKAFAQISATAESANTGMTELSQRVADFEGQPLLLWWDGTGDPPPLKPGWALFNVSTREVTF